MSTAFFARRKSQRLLAGVLLMTLLAASAVSAGDGRKKPIPRGTVDVEPLAGPKIRVRLKTEKLTLATPYGTLLIPVADIQRIEFAVRVGDEEKQRIAHAIADLASRQYRVRQAASAVLLRLAEKAYPCAARRCEKRGSGGPAAGGRPACGACSGTCPTTYRRFARRTWFTPKARR